MARLNSRQLQMLKQANIPQIAITAYENGRAAPGVKRQIESILQQSPTNTSLTGTNPILPNSGSGLGGQTASQGGGMVNGYSTIWDDPGAMDRLVGGNALVDAGPWVSQRQPTGPPRDNTPWRPPSGFSVIPKPQFGEGYPPGYGSSGPYPPGWTGPRLPPKASSPGAGGGSGYPPLGTPGADIPTSDPNAGPYPDPPVYSELPPFPDLPDLQIPQIVARDFMPQSLEAMAAAYAPLFQMLENTKTNIQQQGDRSQHMVGGAYDDAIADMAARAAATAQNNQQAIGANQQAGAQLGQTIGQNYMGNNEETAQLLKNLGIESAAPQVLGDTANQASWQQGQAAQSTDAQNDYLTNSGLADQKYASDMQDVMSNQKAVTASDIANQVAQNLFETDQLKLGYDSEKVQRAIEMALSLRSEDIGLQQANAQNSITGQQANINELLGGYEAGVAGTNASNEAKQQAFNNIMSIRQEMDKAFQQSVLNQQWKAGYLSDQEYRQRQLEIQQGQLDLDTQVAADRSATDIAGGGENAPKPTDAEANRLWWASQPSTSNTPNNVVWDAMFKIAQELGATYSDAELPPETKSDIIKEARRVAVQNGWNEDVAARMMNDIIKTSVFGPTPSGGG